ncbi:hypothetical protein [Microvirus mar50]|uniref:Uncharacterized protein n=1 Tax=Microvirus mar50 TaxID=2851186 RepID=A0A8F5ML69_9VIRU|nr:hypothetical protein [Microvirus mar50]
MGTRRHPIACFYICPSLLPFPLVFHCVAPSRKRCYMKNTRGVAGDGESPVLILAFRARSEKLAHKVTLNNIYIMNPTKRFVFRAIFKLLDKITLILEILFNSKKNKKNE